MRHLTLVLLIISVTHPMGAQTTGIKPEPAQVSDKRIEVGRLNDQTEKLIVERKFDEAMPLAERALALSETAFGQGDAAVATAALNLAILHIVKGKSGKAEPLLLKAIEINDTARKPTDPILIKTVQMYTCNLINKEQTGRLKEFETNRIARMRASAEPDRFWGAISNVTKVVKVPKPDYPAGAPGVASGFAPIAMTVDEEGKVIRTERMCGGNVLLLQGAEESARKAQFKPLLIDGKPIRFITYIPYRFEFR